MTKWILLFTTTLQIASSVALANKALSSENFNTLINDVSAEQTATTQIIWDSKKVNNYLRKKRALENTKTMIADSTSGAFDL